MFMSDPGPDFTIKSDPDFKRWSVSDPGLKKLVGSGSGFGLNIKILNPSKIDLFWMNLIFDQSYNTE